MSTAGRSVGATLTLALIVSVGAQCLVGLEGPAERMPCCAGIGQDCHSAAMSEVCCRIEEGEQTTPLPQFRPIVPALGSIEQKIRALMPPVDTRGAVVGDAATLTATSPPKYILLASFLI